MPRILPSFVKAPSAETRKTILQRNRTRQAAREAKAAEACVDRAAVEIASTSESFVSQKQEKRRPRTEAAEQSAVASSAPSPKRQKKRSRAVEEAVPMEDVDSKSGFDDLRFDEEDEEVEEEVEQVEEENVPAPTAVPPPAVATVAAATLDIDHDMNQEEESEIDEEEANDELNDELNRSGRRNRHDDDEMDDFLVDDDEEEDEEEFIPMDDDEDEEDSDDDDGVAIYGNEKVPKAAGVSIDSLRKHHAATVGQHKISVVQGDLTSLSVDALVHPTDSYLSLHGAVGGALSSQAASSGADLLRILSCRKTRLDANAACVTQCARIKGLPCRMIVHVHSPNYRQVDDTDKALTEAVLSVLEKADTAKAKVLAMPSIGTGRNRYPAGEAARVMVRAVKAYFKATPNSKIQHVYFVLYDRRTSRHFVDALRAAT